MLLWVFYFSAIKYAIPIPISSPNILPFPWESHGNPNSHAHLYRDVLLGHDLESCQPSVAQLEKRSYYSRKMLPLTVSVVILGK